jgi:prophage regulatory protein
MGMSDRLVRVKSVLAQVPLSRTTIYRMISAGTFPRPLQVTEHTVAWPQSTIDAWIAARPLNGVTFDSAK